MGQKAVGQMTMDEVGKAGSTGYFKMLMITVGIGLFLLGLVLMAMDFWMKPE